MNENNLCMQWNKCIKLAKVNKNGYSNSKCDDVRLVLYKKTFSFHYYCDDDDYCFRQSKIENMVNVLKSIGIT